MSEGGGGGTAGSREAESESVRGSGPLSLSFQTKRAGRGWGKPPKGLGGAPKGEARRGEAALGLPEMMLEKEPKLPCQLASHRLVVG